MPGFEAGDFTEVGGPCSVTSCEFELTSFLLPIDDALLTPFGDTFDVGVLLLTSASGLGTSSADADFFNTASVSVTTEQQGVTIVPAASTAGVPEPATIGLVSAGLLLLGARRLRF